MSYKKELKAQYRAKSRRMAELIAHGNATIRDREEASDLKRDLDSIDNKLAGLKNEKSDTRGVTPGNKRGKRNIEGGAGEQIRSGQFGSWLKRARENDVHITAGTKESGYHDVSLRNQGTDRDLNRWWGERLGFAKPTMESRALLEDTVGSLQAATPQEWNANYIDVLLPQTVLGRVGAVSVPMAQETMNIPVFSSTVSPAWIAEAGSISIDANPAFSVLPLFATAGFKDITLFSVEAAQDAYLKGDLDGMLARAVANKMKVVLDTSMLLGVAGNTGIPGLNAESGFNFRHYTGDAGTTGKAPVDTTELSVVAELIRNKYVEPNAVVSNPAVYGTLTRLNASTYGKYWDWPADVKKLANNWVYSANSALPMTETDPATASAVLQTTGTFSSFYVGDWSRFCYIGMHMDLQTTLLKERYIDSGQYGLFSFCRYSIRFAHPETFYRTIGLITT